MDCFCGGEKKEKKLDKGGDRGSFCRVEKGISQRAKIQNRLELILQYRWPPGREDAQPSLEHRGYLHGKVRPSEMAIEPLPKSEKKKNRKHPLKRSTRILNRHPENLGLSANSSDLLFR